MSSDQLGRLLIVDDDRSVRQSLSAFMDDLQFLVYTGSKAFVPTDELRALGLETEQVFFKPLPDMTVLVEAIQKCLARREQSHVK